MSANEGSLKAATANTVTTNRLMRKDTNRAMAGEGEIDILYGHNMVYMSYIHCTQPLDLRCEQTIMAAVLYG